MRSRAHFVKVNPSGNTTALVLDPFPREIYSRIAAALMEPSSLAAEQVGFVERAALPGAVARLHMMGGEFCGNAARGLAAWLAVGRFPGTVMEERSRCVTVPIEVSGHGGLLAASVQWTESEKQAHVSMAMPLPQWVRKPSEAAGGHPFSLVGFRGIVHAVVWNLEPSDGGVQRVREGVFKELGEVDCLGVMFYDEGRQRMTPVVFVRDVGSLVWESSCGSGSVAVASALADREGKSVRSLAISQPGGMIEVDVAWEKGISEARIGGEVAIEAEGTVYFAL